MIRIALVEDDSIYRAQLEEYLLRYSQCAGERFEIRSFGDGDEIATNYRPVYDIILLDIQMEYMDGMTTAAEIRKVDAEAVIIFITNMAQYAIRGYAVDALDYIMKPISYFDFSRCLDRALARLRKHSRRFLFLAGKNNGQKVEHSRILFVEVNDHQLIYHLKGGESITAFGTMKEVEANLNSPAFFRCNKCYLVNLEHVDGIRDGDAVVGGEVVQISRSKKQAFLAALNRYLNEVDL